jgi:hypothetical protein
MLRFLDVAMFINLLIFLVDAILHIIVLSSVGA